MVYVALLRGINVGGNKKVDMKKLKLTFQKLGFSNVKTYINSGNVIFEAKSSDTLKLCKKIEKVVEADFGFIVPVLVRDANNIAKLCAAIPPEWTNDADQRTDVMFLWDDVNSPKFIQDLGFDLDIERTKHTHDAVVWNIERKNVGKSKIPKMIGSKFYKQMTARNINTVRKLRDLMLSVTK